MNKEFKASHFDNIEELLKHCDMWIKDEDYDAYCRWFDMGAMEEIVNYANDLEQTLNEIKELVEELSDNTDDTTCYDIDKDTKEDILQIIDKSIGDEE